MQRKMKFLSLLLPVVCAACSWACNPINPAAISDQVPTLVTNAEDAMKGFFTALNQGDYSQAAERYGGSYDVLQGYNPTLEPEDHAALLQAGCEFNGLMCLKVRETLSIQTGDPHEFFFEVEFANSDGSTFLLGPCCGETEETMPPESVFIIRVRCQEDGTCQVLDLPPYVP